MFGSRYRMCGRWLSSCGIPVLTLTLFPSAINARAVDRPTEQAALVSEKILSALIETNGVPGMGAAVWRNGKVVWSGSAGYRDVERKLPVNSDTIFRLASVSKLISVAAAARLKQDKFLDVDQPVASILPYLSNKWAPLTTRQLAAHTAGVPHYQDIDAKRGGIYYTNVRDAVNIFDDRDLLFSPGSKYSYSSWGYTLLSAVVEQRAAMPFVAYVEKRITPGLVIVPDATDSGNTAASKAYEFVDAQARPAAPHDYSYTWAGGGFGATSKSLAEFGGRMMRGKIVSPETFDWMLKPTTLNDGSVAMDGDNVVGFGWRTSKDADGDRVAHHAGVTIGARSALVLWPERSVAVSLLSNALWVSSIEQSAMMIAAPFKPEPAGLVASPCPTKVAHYEGKFGDSRVAGASRFAFENGVCVGEIVLDKLLADYFNAFPQRDALKLRVIGIDPSGGLPRAALVTPIGIYDFRAQADGSYCARFGPKRALSLTYN
jgi:serine beta-lactamase-like protein LACTB, mitochondrial